MVDKFLEQALLRCSNKSYNTQPRESVGHIEVQAVAVAAPPAKKTMKRKPQSIPQNTNYNSA